MPPKPFIASRLYLKPLFSENMTPVEPEEVLRRAKTDLMRRIKRELTQTTLSDRAKKALSRALTIEVRQSSLVIIGRHPGFGPLLRGQKKEQMKWLVKAKAPIPIVTDEGELIFRTASSRSMANGRWWHPGRPKQDFVERAKKKSREFLKAKFNQEISRKLNAAWTR